MARLKIGQVWSDIDCEFDPLIPKQGSVIVKKLNDGLVYYENIVGFIDYLPKEEFINWFSYVEDLF